MKSKHILDSLIILYIVDSINRNHYILYFKGHPRYLEEQRGDIRKEIQGNFYLENLMMDY